MSVWTTEAPTDEGYYWACRKLDEPHYDLGPLADPCPVEVIQVWGGSTLDGEPIFEVFELGDERGYRTDKYGAWCEMTFPTKPPFETVRIPASRCEEHE